jgi:hypothetical protein
MYPARRVLAGGVISISRKGASSSGYWRVLDSRRERIVALAARHRIPRFMSCANSRPHSQRREAGRLTGPSSPRNLTSCLTSRPPRRSAWRCRGFFWFASERCCRTRSAGIWPNSALSLQRAATAQQRCSRSSPTSKMIVFQRPQRFSLGVLARQYAAVRAEIVAIEKRIHAWHRSCEESRRLEEIPGGHLEKFLSPSRHESDSVTARGHGRMPAVLMGPTLSKTTSTTAARSSARSRTVC